MNEDQIISRNESAVYLWGGGVSPFPPPQELMGKGLNEVGLQINPEFVQPEGLQKMLSGPPP